VVKEAADDPRLVTMPLLFVATEKDKLATPGEVRHTAGYPGLTRRRQRCKEAG